MSSKVKRKTNNNYSDYIPYEKSSKKEKRSRDRQQRNEWDIPPMTKVIPDKRKKKKEKYKRDDYYDDCDDWQIITILGGDAIIHSRIYINDDNYVILIGGI